MKFAASPGERKDVWEESRVTRGGSHIIKRKFITGIKTKRASVETQPVLNPISYEKPALHFQTACRNGFMRKCALTCRFSSHGWKIIPIFAILEISPGK